MPPKKSAPTKRKAVTLAADADVVLTKCRELRDSLRRKSSAEEAASEQDGEWNISSDDDNEEEQANGAKDGKKKTAKTQRISLAELKRATAAGGEDGKSTIVEVAEMNSTQVMEGIENVAVKIARQVLAKQVSLVLDVFCSLIYCHLDIIYSYLHHYVHFCNRASNLRYQAGQRRIKFMFQSWIELSWETKLEREAS